MLYSHIYNKVLMEVVFLMLRKIKDRSGGAAIETILVVMLVFPLIVMFIVGAFTFFNVHSQNVNINFDADTQNIYDKLTDDGCQRCTDDVHVENSDKYYTKDQIDDTGKNKIV